MTLQELEALFRLCRKYGCTSYTSPEIQFTLTQEEPAKKPRKSKNEKEELEPEYSEEEVLLWSTPSV